MNFLHRAWAEIDLDALDFNLEQIRSFCPNKKIIAVVKANAYGHCDVICAKEYLRLGIRNYAVSNIAEAVQIRNTVGADSEILVFGYVPEENFTDAMDIEVTFTIGSVEYAKRLNNFAAGIKKKAKCHIKLDTGMSRVGVRTREEISEILSLPFLEITGIYTHFSVADMPDEEDTDYTLKQEEKFCFLTEGLNIPRHSQNSGGILFHPDFIGDYIRPGIILYGLSANVNVKSPIPLKQVLTLKSRIDQIKTVPYGTCVSYGRTYMAKGEEKLALVPVGYADGYSRSLSNKGMMAVNGNLCPVRGRVCMDQTLIDVTHLPKVREGDEVLVYSDKFKETSLDYIAPLCGTITNELVCQVSARVPRIPVRNGVEL